MRNFINIAASFMVASTVSSNSASAQSGFLDGNFDVQGASINDYCYFMFGTCPAGSWTSIGTSGFIRSGSPSWGSVLADTPSSYGFVQSDGQLIQSFTATGSGQFQFSWSDADRPIIGGQTYRITINGAPIGTYSPTTSIFTRRTSAAFSLTNGMVYTVKFEGMMPGQDKSALIDSVKLVSAQAAITYIYDALGRLVSTTVSGGANTGFHSQYRLDAAGNRVNVTTAGIQ